MRWGLATAELRGSRVGSLGLRESARCVRFRELASSEAPSGSLDDWRANSPTSVTLKARFHCTHTPRLEPHVTEERKFPILFAATAMRARKLMDIDGKAKSRQNDHGGQGRPKRSLHPRPD